ncbi:Calcineurin-like phosphoesterase domain ApaH type [Trinorchestia longiramus]|nr:Calcineurin-like phosphoesterase domain ApaH type [Trinorchestia longiramus]
MTSAFFISQVIQVVSLDGGVTGVDASPYSSSLHLHSSEDSDVDEDPLNQLIWFIQVSDLHFSIWKDPSRITEFRDFCHHTVHTIKPAVVLASGDLTDAKSENGMGSQQYIEEWQHYKSVLQETGLYNTTVWLDIRGNHDNFNMASLAAASNLYESESVQGPLHQRSYLHSVHLRGMSVAFIAVDTTLLPGPRRPFNFVGVLPPSELTLLKQLAVEGRTYHNHTVWFGHYPTSCIVGPEHGCKDLRSVMAGGAAYLCGHLHSLGGLVPAMHARHHNGLLELELEDWKDGRMFRVMAIDKGSFSFIDVRHTTWPLMLVTSPPHALYVPVSSSISAASTIRVLAWSPSTIRRLAVRLDSSSEWLDLNHVRGPLYSVHWQPALYAAGLHTIEVLAQDVDGRQRIIKQPFSVDGSKPNFRFWPRVLLMSNISAVFQFLFGCSVCVCILILCVFKYLHLTMASNGRRNICRGGIFRWTIVRGLVRKFWLLSSVDQIFWPLIIYMLYLPVGPWMVGELLDNEYGVVFSWGTFVYHSFLPGSLTFAYGFALFLFYLLPLLFGLANCIDHRMHSLFVRPRLGLLAQLSKNVPLVIPLSIQSFLTYLMFLAYGWMCVIIGPIRSWSVVLGLALWLRAERLEHKHLQSAAQLWCGYNLQRTFVNEGHSLTDGCLRSETRSWLRRKSSSDEVTHRQSAPCDKGHCVGDNGSAQNDESYGSCAQKNQTSDSSLDTSERSPSL